MRVAIAVAIAVVGSGCGPASVLAPEGPGAARAARLAAWLFVGGAAIYVAVLAALGLAVRRRREGTPSHGHAVERRARRAVVGGGVVLPLAAILPLSVASIRGVATHSGEPRAALTVEVAAWQWWWELGYRAPGYPGVVLTANELHLPAGQTVAIRLTARDVIHSFWIPVLQGKLDAVPGRTTVTWLHAGRPGIYPGLCAEFCGLQHAQMGLRVVVEPADRFEAWLAAEARPASPPNGEAAGRGAAVFVVHCSRCHAVRGTSLTSGREGPDLTHLGARGTLAAGTLPNSPEALARWITDPGAVKPGTRMPRVDFRPGELEDLLAYLGTLR